MTAEPMTWDPDSYMAFADQRSRPGLELIARINHPKPEIIVDLGCGPGHLTAVLARRWPEATIGINHLTVSSAGWSTIHDGNREPPRSI